MRSCAYTDLPELLGNLPVKIYIMLLKNLIVLIRVDLLTWTYLNYLDYFFDLRGQAAETLTQPHMLTKAEAHL